MRGKFFDYTSYFSQSGDGSNMGKTAILTSVESTLDLASEIGWVKDKTQYEAVKESYLLEVSNQQQQQSSLEGEEQHPPAAGGGPGGSQLRRSHDKQQKSSASGPANSGGGVAAGGSSNSRHPANANANAKKSSSGDGSHHHNHPTGGQDSSQVNNNNNNNNNNSHSMAAPSSKFDYSKLHSQQAMSALPGRDSNRESRPNKGYHGGKAKQDSASNPFLFKSK